MKEIKFSVLGITQSGKTTAIVHLAKNYKVLSCLCSDAENGRTKISVRYYFGKNIIKDEFKLVKTNSDGIKIEKPIESYFEFAKIINCENSIVEYDYAEAYLIPNDILCKILVDNNINQIVLYDTRGLMDIATKINDENKEMTITDLTKVGIDKPDAVLFYYAKEGSSNIKTLYTDLIQKTFSSVPFFVFIRAEEQDKKKYNNLIQGVINFFKGICIKLNFSIETNDVKVKANFELNNNIEVNAKLNLKLKEEDSLITPYFNSEKDIVYRLSEYDLTTFEDEDKFICEMNNHIKKIIKHTLDYNQAMTNKQLLEYLDNESLEKEIIELAMGDIRKYEGGSIRKTNYCYPEKNQGVNYERLLMYYKENEIIGPNNGISTRDRDGRYRYFYTIVMCTLVYNAIYVIFYNSDKDERLKSLLRTALLKVSDSFYCSSFLFNRFVIKKSIEAFRQTTMNNDIELFKIVVNNAINILKEQITSRIDN